MVKFSSRKDALTFIKTYAAQDAMLFLINEQASNAEAELLLCNPQDPKLMNKLVKAQELRSLEQQLRSDLK
jgi:hypothetical protein